MKYILILFTFLQYTLTFSQDSGKIVFEEKIDLYRHLPPEREDMKNMMPQYNTSMFELIFSGDQSIYQAQKEADDKEVTANTGGGQMMMRFGRENRVVYKNLAEDQMVESRDFMQKQFLIKGPPTPRKWKIGSKQKEILGHKCMEANCQVDSTTSVTAWFTTQIPVSNGPGDYQGLPGLILGVDINNGERSITATEIKMDSVDQSLIIPPSKGKEVTSEEFDKIRKDKMKEMHLQNGDGQRTIMIRHD